MKMVAVRERTADLPLFRRSVIDPGASA